MNEGSGPITALLSAAVASLFGSLAWMVKLVIARGFDRIKVLEDRERTVLDVLIRNDEKQAANIELMVRNAEANARVTESNRSALVDASRRILEGVDYIRSRIDTTITHLPRREDR
jgi:hypothetical protein